jgi:hypothetical protein
MVNIVYKKAKLVEPLLKYSFSEKNILPKEKLLLHGVKVAMCGGNVHCDSIYQ